MKIVLQIFSQILIVSGQSTLDCLNKSFRHLYRMNLAGCLVWQGIPHFGNTTRWTILLHYAVVTQHIKELYYYNWLHSATCFGRYPAIIMPKRNSVNSGTFIGFFQWDPIVYIKNLHAYEACIYS